MSVPPANSSALAMLHGDALESALRSHFQAATESVTVGSSTWSLFKPANADHLISEADYVMDERLPYWADLWPSAHALAATIHQQAGADRTLLELGCGLGLATIAAVEAGFAVTATDYYEDALHVTRLNAWRALGREPVTRLVNWRQWPADIGCFDVVMAADVLYEKEYALLVAETLAKALSPSGTAFLADPGRLALPAFRERLTEVGLTIVETTRIRYDVGAVHQEIQVMRITWRQTATLQR